MGKVADTLLVSAVVRETIDFDVPLDILDRLARRVDEARFHSHGGIRTHALVSTKPALFGGYREAEGTRALRVVAVQSSPLPDVTFELEGRRLRYEARSPKLRLIAALVWCMFIVIPALSAVSMRWRSNEAATWIVIGTVAATAVIAWLFAAALVRDLRKSIAFDVRRIVREAASE